MPASGSFGRQRRVLDERRIRGQGRRDRVDRGELLEIDPHEARGLLGGVERLGGDRGHGVAVELRLADREHGPVPQLWAEARHRVREVGGGHDEPDAGHGKGRARVDPADPRPRHVERDELHVEHVLEVDVGDVLLPPGDALDPADARRRLPDASLGRDLGIGRRRSVADCRAQRRAPALRAPPPRPPARPRRSARSRRTGSSCRPGLPPPPRASGAARDRAGPAPRRAGPGCRTRTGPPRCRGTPAGAGSARRRPRALRRS